MTRSSGLLLVLFSPISTLEPVDLLMGDPSPCLRIELQGRRRENTTVLCMPYQQRTQARSSLLLPKHKRCGNLLPHLFPVNYHTTLTTTSRTHPTNHPTIITYCRLLCSTCRAVSVPESASASERSWSQLSSSRPTPGLREDSFTKSWETCTMSRPYRLLKLALQLLPPSHQKRVSCTIM